MVITYSRVWINVCMYVCIYVRMFVDTYVCMYISIHVCMHVYMYTSYTVKEDVRAGRYSLTKIPNLGVRCTSRRRFTGTGMDVVPNLPKCPVPVLMSYRTYRSVRNRYGCYTKLTKVSGIIMDVVPNLPKCPVPVWMLYRSYRSVRYRYGCRTGTSTGIGTDLHTGTSGIYTEHTRYFTAIPACISTYF